MLAASSPVAAATLEVGPGKPFDQPSQAAAVAQTGDRVVIAPGEYFDCAVWQQDNAVIEGDPGGGTVITDKACQGKALFVIAGNDVTVRNLTLTRARVPDNNGAGIRAEGRNLLVEGVRFVNNQDGILTIDQPQGTVRIERCVFAANGIPGEQRPTGGLLVGRMDRLVVHDTQFEQGRGGTVIVSAARLTKITRSQIALPQNPRGAPVQISGGLAIEESVLQAGPAPGERETAVLALPGPDADAPLVLRGNRLENRGILLLNWSGRDPVLEGNLLGPDSQESSTSGAWSHGVRSVGREVYNSLRRLAGAARHRLLAPAGNGS
jgi:hypothetical protein